MQELRIHGVSKRYGHFTALEPTDLTVAAGEFVTLLGPSGSGKTTLLSLIAGLAEPDSGRILLDGVDVSGLPAHRRGLGMVFQNYALFPHMTVAENVAFGLQTRRLAAAEVQDKVQRALTMVRLEALAHRVPKELSGGQQQRVALARALAYQPAIVLMDEPLGALDRNLREEMKFEIARLHRELGTSVVYVTHDQEEALVLSDRICLMNRARVEQIDPPETLYFRPQTRFAAEFLGESNLLDCTVSRTPNQPLAQITVTSLGLNLQHDAPAANGPALLMLRPESIEIETPLHPAPADALRLQGVLMERIFLGPMTRLLVRIGSSELKILKRTTSMHELRGLELGTPVDIWLDPERCHILKA
ncbi:MAG: spermidine/putrescine ABC transporter ATP-binding protein [Betaproteobacteria bacterium HGW-Betaproteobacteria-9]|jgi:putative spermidine/putrescine transport system ATP-binding protein|nr:MAG: spermidine/putrescine ABC transporter ATP-binding protein [Betaproteobacteria bacterium HGW-Betaproteobacteria-9]